VGIGRPIDPPLASELCWRSSSDEWSGAIDGCQPSKRFVINTLPRFFQRFRRFVDPRPRVPAGTHLCWKKENAREINRSSPSSLQRYNVARVFPRLFR